MLLQDPARSFWIAALSCWRNLGVFLSEGACFLCWFPFFGAISKEGSFLAIGFFFKINHSFFHSPGWKAGDDGPWIPLRCSLPVCVV